MMGNDFFWERFQPHTCSGMKTAKSDQVKGNCINVFIDLNRHPVGDFVVIDEDEFVEEESQASRVPRRDSECPFQRFIFIDDDDNDDDSTNAYNPGNIAVDGRELDSDASSSERFSPATGYMQNDVHINVDDCHVKKEKVSASNFPKNRITKPAKIVGRSCCGLDGFESGSSESYSSDCEIMEVPEEWEKAQVKRKQHVNYDQAGFDDQVSYCAVYTDIGMENRTWQHAGSPSYSGPSNGKCVKESLSSFSDMGDCHINGTNSDVRGIISKREKLKESEEYKRAMQEEWASRQEQVRLQAEEVQRLRKRKRAESMRSLEMQRRQKERIEEVRETQKKDEEKMSMKEKLRDEITKGLRHLEMTCIDMASLLRCLGIQVGGGSDPLPHEVRAAYRQALLKFHPDRASKSDIREQVEAEEKFKLISRMKDRLSSPSCY